MFGACLFSLSFPFCVILSKYVLFHRSREWDLSKRESECYRHAEAFFNLGLVVSLLLGLDDPSLLCFLFYGIGFFSMIRIEEFKRNEWLGVVIWFLMRASLTLLHFLIWKNEMTEIGTSLAKVELWMVLIIVPFLVEKFFRPFTVPLRIRKAGLLIQTCHGFLVWLSFEKEIWKSHPFIWCLSFGLVIWGLFMTVAVFCVVELPMQTEDKKTHSGGTQ